MPDMQFTTSHSRIAPRLVDALYTEAMLLADEARTYFDVGGAADRDALPPLPRVTFSCEALRVTTRLMHIVAWLLTRRAIEAGEIPPGAVQDYARRLGRAEDSDPAAYATLPAGARELIDASRELYQRIERIDGGLDSAESLPSPARSLLGRLQRAF
jgi:regulator of CtrA degradation